MNHTKRRSKTVHIFLLIYNTKEGKLKKNDNKTVNKLKKIMRLSLKMGKYDYKYLLYSVANTDKILTEFNNFIHHQITKYLLK